MSDTDCRGGVSADICELCLSTLWRGRCVNSDCKERKRVKEMQAALDGIDAALKRHGPHLSGGREDAGHRLAADVRSMLDVVGIGRQTSRPSASEPASDPASESVSHHDRWVVGHPLGRGIWRNGSFVGIVDTVALANEIVIRLDRVDGNR
jgi:hypothetical protein